MNYVKVENNIPVEVMTKPEWYDAETRQLLTDQQLIDREGVYPLDYETNKPTINSFYQNLHRLPMSQWTYDSVNQKYIVEYKVVDIPIDNIYGILLSQIKNNVNREFEEGTVNSSLGFTADARRNGKDMDKDNVQELIDIGSFPVQFKDADGNFHSLSESDLQTLKTELGQKGLWVYQHKWEKESELQTIKDNYDSGADSYSVTIGKLKYFIVW